MEDAKEQPFNIEIFIAQKNRQGVKASAIADLLLKLWNKNQLDIDAKYICGKFCFLNGLFAPVIQAIRQDLTERKTLCWPLVFEVVKKTDPKLTEAMHNGAIAEDRLLSLALSALTFHHSDPRWKNVVEDQLSTRIKKNFALREKLVNEFQFYKREKLNDEAKNVLEQLKEMFPDDEFIKVSDQKLEEVGVNHRLKTLREKFPIKRFEIKKIEDDNVEWTELDVFLRDNIKDFDLESVYDLSIALHEMGFYDMALKVLRQKKRKWTAREKLLHVDFLLAEGSYVEALAESQTLIAEDPTDTELSYACLYNMAFAHHGLNDIGSAIAILKGIFAHLPTYRNIAQLISDWETSR